MPKMIDRAGVKYGRLTALSVVPYRPTLDKVRWICRCDCGGEKIVNGSDLESGQVASCGCLAIETRRANGRRKQIYTPAESSLHGRWISMNQRCYNPKHVHFHNYGGRGISVCERWRNSLQNFVADMGLPEQGQTLDRIDNDGNYCPENCRWADALAQGSNRRDNRNITFQNETHCLAEWARRSGIAKHVLRCRLNAGWPIERALTLPRQPGRTEKSIDRRATRWSK